MKIDHTDILNIIDNTNIAEWIKELHELTGAYETALDELHLHLTKALGWDRAREMIIDEYHTLMIIDRR